MVVCIDAANAPLVARGDTDAAEGLEPDRNAERSGAAAKRDKGGANTEVGPECAVAVVAVAIVVAIVFVGFAAAAAAAASPNFNCDRDQVMFLESKSSAPLRGTEARTCIPRCTTTRLLEVGGGHHESLSEYA